MNYAAQIARDGHLLNRPSPQLRKRTWIKKVGKKREGEARVYAKKRKAFLAAHPYCMAGVSGGLVPPTRDIKCVRPPTEIHHTKKPKCKYLNDESTWLAVCRPCHNWIEDHKSNARAIGLLQ